MVTKQANQPTSSRTRCILQRHGCRRLGIGGPWDNRAELPKPGAASAAPGPRGIGCRPTAGTWPTVGETTPRRGPRPRQWQQARIRATACHGGRTFARQARLCARGPGRAWPRCLRWRMPPASEDEFRLCQDPPCAQVPRPHRNAIALAGIRHAVLKTNPMFGRAQAPRGRGLPVGRSARCAADCRPGPRQAAGPWQSGSGADGHWPVRQTRPASNGPD